MNINSTHAKHQHVLPEATPFIVGDSASDPVESVEEHTDRNFENLAPSNISADLLEKLSVDELRKLASQLGVPEVGTITETDDLIKAIKARLA